ncbi:MAG: DMT family transporter [Anaerolineaceae bacterium]|nr:DMT family transporter [Anaerolineaceae bacterium]
MKKPSRIKAILLAVLVTIIWSTSWVLIKIGLADIPAMTFAGLRYMLASLLFFPLLLKRDIREQIKRLSRREWGVMVLLGVVLYTVGQGGQYLGLAYLPSVTVSLILNLSALFVAVVSSITIKERLNWLQWIGVLLNLAGVVIYFNPINNPLSGHWLGWFFAILCLVGNSVGSIIGRDVNRSANIHPIVITGISMTIGSTLMLVTGILWQGLPPLSAQSIWIIVILAVVNTAVCFTLWNYTQQTLQATETAIMNNTMLVYVSILAWIFLGEKQTPLGIVGLILALAGAMLVQVQLKKQPKLA